MSYAVKLLKDPGEFSGSPAGLYVVANGWYVIGFTKAGQAIPRRPRGISGMQLSDATGAVAVAIDRKIGAQDAPRRRRARRASR